MMGSFSLTINLHDTPYVPYNFNMLILIGFRESEIETLREHHLGVIYSVGAGAKKASVMDIVNDIEKFTGDGAWHERKFVIMHGLDNEGIKNTLSVFKNLGLRDVIFATTTPTSLTWTLENLLNELIEEHEYFKRQKSR